ncbi:MAG TPA: hypothetical protein VMB73_04360 [Acetobacteraceae bacterium]|nr:hypothetical protein [Acetobacteraceae bacterium]
MRIGERLDLVAHIAGRAETAVQHKDRWTATEGLVVEQDAAGGEVAFTMGLAGDGLPDAEPQLSALCPADCDGGCACNQDHDSENAAGQFTGHRCTEQGVKPAASPTSSGIKSREKTSTRKKRSKYAPNTDTLAAKGPAANILCRTYGL